MQKKTKGRKNYVLEAEELAKYSRTSVSMVEKVRTAKKKGVEMRGRKALRILAVEQLAEESKSILIKELERIVKL